MSKPRILVVEDEKVVAADIEVCIRRLGYEVVGSAATGAEALRKAVTEQPDLVLMDIKLKGALDGIDVANALSEDLRIPVVYLTAHADAEILDRAKKTAPVGYVLKPFDERTLHTEIEIAYDRHQREKRLVEGSLQLATALGSIDEAVIVTHGGQVALMNRVAETLTGWSQADAIGKPVGDVFVLLNGETGSLMPSPIGRVQREGISIALGDRSVLSARNGTRIPIQGSAAPVRDSDGNVGVSLLFRSSSQRAADENWGAPEHTSLGRLEILGRLTTAVAAKLAALLETNNETTRAAGLVNLLLKFGQRQPAPPVALDLNELVSGMEDLLRCALGSDLALRMKMGAGSRRVKADPGQVELILLHLAVSTQQCGASGAFVIETAGPSAGDMEDGYATLTVVPPDNGAISSVDLPALDEIARQSPGEIRVSRENGAVDIYLPTIFETAETQPGNGA